MKNYKKILLLLIVISVVSLLIGFVVRPNKTDLCSHSYVSCMLNYPDTSWGKPFFIIPFLPLLIFIILYFLPNYYYKAWKWFAILFGIASIALVTILPSTNNDFLFPRPKEFISWTTSILFAIISLVIILVQTFFHFRKKGNDKK